MPMFLCRWPSGDCSVVQAADQREAVIKLDEVNNAEGCPLAELQEFQAHFHLTDDGLLELVGVGEETEDALWDVAYPVLDDVHAQIAEEQSDIESSELTSVQQDRIHTAVQLERDRVTPTLAEEPQTELGRDLKKKLGASTALVDDLVRRSGEHVLKELKPPPKPH